MSLSGHAVLNRMAIAARSVGEWQGSGLFHHACLVSHGSIVLTRLKTTSSSPQIVSANCNSLIENVICLILAELRGLYRFGSIVNGPCVTHAPVLDGSIYIVGTEPDSGSSTAISSFIDEFDLNETVSHGVVVGDTTVNRTLPFPASKFGGDGGGVGVPFTNVL